MANLYGVATPNPLPVGANTIGGADVVCASGAETNLFAIVVNNPTANGWYYPNFLGYIALSIGATPPTSVNLGWRLNGGADMANLPIAPLAFTASTTIIVPCTLQSSGTIISNPAGVNTFQVSLTPVAQAVTVRFVGSFCQGSWVRATDQ